MVIRSSADAVPFEAGNSNVTAKDAVVMAAMAVMSCGFGVWQGAFLHDRGLGLPGKEPGGSEAQPGWDRRVVFLVVFCLTQTLILFPKSTVIYPVKTSAHIYVSLRRTRQPAELKFTYTAQQVGFVGSRYIPRYLCLCWDGNCWPTTPAAGCKSYHHPQLP